MRKTSLVLHTRFQIALPLLLLPLLACEEPPPVETWHGQHVTVTTSEDIRLCEGTLDFYDRAVTQAHLYWTGEEPPEDFEVRLELRAPVEPGEPVSGTDIARRFAWATDNDSALHELGRLVVGANDGDSTPGLATGAAEALMPGFRLAQFVTGTADLEDLLFDPAVAHGYRSSAAALVGFLIRRYGLARVREAYRAVDGTMTAAEVEATLVRVFGEGLHDALVLYGTGQQRACPLQVWECGDAVLPNGTLPIEVDRDSCDDPSAQGAVGDGEAFFPRHMFTLDLEAETTLRADVSDNAYIYVEHCFASCEELAWPWFDSGSALIGDGIWTATHRAGRYIVIIEPVDAAQPYSADVRVVANGS